MSGRQSLLGIQEQALPKALFHRLLRKVRAVKGERLPRTYQTTFWFDLREPTNVVEEAILALKSLLPQRRSVIGVEWWLSRMRTAQVQVDFHRDRDEKLARTTGRVIHPKCSSILFLNRVKGGLLAVSAQPPNDRNPARAPNRLDFALARPHPNRLVFFAGSRTHGVLDANNQLPGVGRRGPGRLRLAVVMNWWHRRPLDVPRFSESDAYRVLAVRSHPKGSRAPMQD